MNFPFYVARRYLFAPKSHHAINIISGISVCGVALATMALVCTLSVFNGFRDMVASLFTAFDPELKVMPVSGKYLRHQDPKLLALRENSAIDICTETLEDQALIIYGGHQALVTLKGVEDNFIELTDIGNVLYGEGVFQLHADVFDFGIMGGQLAQQMDVGALVDSDMQVYAPKKGEKVNLANPAASFSQAELQVPNLVFSVMQGKYDAHYVLTSLRFTQQLFDTEGQFTALELKCKDGVNIQQLKNNIKEQLGHDYRVWDRYEQQADVFRIMEIEKLLSYLFLTFILMVACFNMVGCLSMLMIDKKDDVKTLRNLGASNSQIQAVFQFEGRMIALSGALIGMVLGIFLCWGQQTYGWLTLGQANEGFLFEAYPVSMHVSDLIAVLITVVTVGFLAVWYPVRYLSKRLL